MNRHWLSDISRPRIKENQKMSQRKKYIKIKISNVQNDSNAQLIACLNKIIGWTMFASRIFKSLLQSLLSNHADHCRDMRHNVRVYLLCQWKTHSHIRLIVLGGKIEYHVSHFLWNGQPIISNINISDLIYIGNAYVHRLQSLQSAFQTGMAWLIKVSQSA